MLKGVISAWQMDKRWTQGDGPTVRRRRGCCEYVCVCGSLWKPSPVHGAFLTRTAVCEQQKNVECDGKGFNLNLISLRRTNRLIPLDAHTMGPRQIAFAVRIYLI